MDLHLQAVHSFNTEGTLNEFKYHISVGPIGRYHATTFAFLPITLFSTFCHKFQTHTKRTLFAIANL